MNTYENMTTLQMLSQLIKESVVAIFQNEKLIKNLIWERMRVSMQQ